MLENNPVNSNRVSFVRLIFILKCRKMTPREPEHSKRLLKKEK